MKKVFVSHPYANNPHKNKILVDKIVKELDKNDDILPVSPLHLFIFMENDNKREDILDMCQILLAGCDEVIFYMYKDGLSNGQIKELGWAKQLDLKINVKNT